MIITLGCRCGNKYKYNIKNTNKLVDKIKFLQQACSLVMFELNGRIVWLNKEYKREINNLEQELHPFLVHF